MNLASVGQGASDKQFGTLSRWRFKEPDVATNRERDDQSRIKAQNPIIEMDEDEMTGSSRR
ncbi:hypothetical protein ZEAMMB73_Zm00001d015387 [Zea mays]|uniref:Uncharacterized protein n=1 Tax=Zea mays TaxID=4577 RepID=A0A1D6H1K4_MAIZE|nr:hypothetical protein ZEAMMB73_Zm00001d015387 [Zea mays]